MRRPRLADIAVNLALAAFGVLVALLLLEAGLRIAGIKTSSYRAIGGYTLYDPELGWTLAPDREGIYRGAHFAVTIRQNGLGLRDRPRRVERTVGARRIVVLGDSVVWCWGVEQDACFTALLEKSLPATEVINTGVPGYSTAQEMLTYERLGRRFAPDLTLLVFVPNDPADNLAEDIGPRFVLDGGALRPVNIPLPRRKEPVGEWLQGHSRAFAELNYAVTVAQKVLQRLGDRVAPDALQPYVPVPPKRAAEAWAVTDALLDRIAADVARDGGRFGIVLEEMPAAMAARMKDYAAARAIPLCDLAPDLVAARAAGRRVRLEGDPHMAAEGHKVAAATLAAWIAREGLLPAD